MNLSTLHLLLILSILINFQSYTKNENFGINDIISILNAKETNQVYEILLKKNFELIDFEETEYSKMIWKYVFKYNKYNETAETWLEYSIYDLDKIAKQNVWDNYDKEKDYFQTPQPFYSTHKIDIITYNENLYLKISEQIKQQKIENQYVLFDKNMKTYVYNYFILGTQYILYKYEESFNIVVALSNKEKELKIKSYEKDFFNLEN